MARWRKFPSHTRLARLATTASLLAAATFTSSCATTWQAQPVPPAEALHGGDSEALLTLKDRMKVRLRDPAVVGDSIVGWMVASEFDDSPPVRRSYAVSEVASVSLRKSDTGLNMATGVMMGGALFIASFMGMWAIACASGCD